VATRGGLVAGLGETNPPTAFVAELGDPAKSAADGITAPLLGAAGHAPARVPKVRIGGRELATQGTRATALAGPAAQADTVEGSGLMRIAGESLASEGDGSAMGGARMVIGGGTQRALQLGGARSAVQPPPAGDTVAAVRSQIPVRTQYGEPNAVHRMLSRVSPPRRRDLAPSELAVLVGDPVDVASGAVVTDAIELLVASPPVALRRRYASNRSDRLGGFGWGWTHDFEQALWLEPGRVVLREADGREIEFDTMGLPGQVARAGDVLHDPTGRLTLRSMGRLHWELRGRTDDGTTLRHFRPEPGESAAGRDRGMSRLVRIVPLHHGPHAGLVELTYRDDARLHEIRSHGRVVVTFEYDATGRIESLWTPQAERLQRHARFVYGPDGDLVAAFDATGAPRRYEYVGHLLVGETNRDGGSFFYGYDGHGPAARCIRSWGAGGLLDRSIHYDGRDAQVTDSLGNVTTYRVEPTGVVAERIDPHGDRTRWRHDDALRIVEAVAADGTRTIDAYDERGNLVKRRLPDGATWRMAYDAHDRLVQGWDPGGARWSFGYDVAGSLVRVEDPLGHLLRLEYDGGRLARIVDPLGQVTTLELDELGNVLTMVAPAATGGGATHYEYDGWGRLAAVRGPSGTRVACVHDAQGRITAHHGDAGAVRLARSAEGELVGVDAPGSRWGIARDAFGIVLAISGPKVAVSYDHDSEGRLVAARCDGLPHLAVLRDARGLVSAISREGGRPSLVQYADRSDRIERIVDGDGAWTLLRWDAAGRIVELERTHGGTTSQAVFGYRSDGLLVSAANAHARWTFDRDARGSVVRQRVVGPGGEVTIESAARDFLGRRHGLDVEPRLRVSMLRSAAGTLERIAIVDDTVRDIEVTHSDDGRIEWLRADFGALELHFDDFGALRSVLRTGQDGRVTHWQPGRAVSPLCAAPAARDALGRPAAEGSAPPLALDEDRTLIGDDGTRWLYHPDHDLPIARLAAGRIDFVLPDAVLVPADPTDARMLRWYDQAFPLTHLPALTPVATAPSALLARAFAHRTWDPIVGGVARTSWSPAGWSAEPADPEPRDGRLDGPRLLSIFAADFPTRGLRPASS
jgi:YD repeat-containing protein